MQKKGLGNGRFYKIDLRYLYIITKSLTKNTKIQNTEPDLFYLANKYLAKTIVAINTENDIRFFLDCYDAKKLGLAFFGNAELCNYRFIKELVEESFLSVSFPEIKKLKRKDFERFIFKEKRNLNWFLRNSKYIKIDGGGQK